jgi:hypothetical protein
MDKWADRAGGVTVVLFHYHIYVGALTIPPDLFTLKTEAAAVYETSGNIPVCAQTPKPNKRNVLAPALLPYLMLRMIVCTHHMYLWPPLFVQESHLQCAGCVTEIADYTPVSGALN